MSQADQPRSSSDELARKRRLFRAFESNKQTEIREAREARQYYHGKQWTDAEIRRLNQRGQPVITSNRIKRKVDFLVGVEQRMRRDPKAYPRNPQHDQGGADVATAGVRYVCEQQRWEQKASAGAHDGLVSGIGVLFVGIADGPHGPDVVLKSVQVDRFFYDPRSEQPDFSDARYKGLSLWMDIDEAKDAHPEHAEALERYLDKDGGLSSFATEEDRAQQWGDFEHRRVRIVELWERRAHGWYFCKFCGDIELESGWSPYTDEQGRPDCPYIAWSPYVDEKGDRYGVVRDMKSIQDEVNHRRSKFLHMLNVRQVFLRDESVVDDIDSFRRELARADGVIVTRGEWGKDAGIVDQSQQIQGQAELLTEAKAELENLGPNPGLIGKGGGVADQSGRAILAQRDSGMTELSPVFDRLRDWKLRVYRAIWARIRQAWTAERWIRITDDPRAPQFLGLNQYAINPATGQVMGANVIAEIDVDIIMEEGPDTITMQEELMQTFAQLGEAAAGPLGRVLIELSNAPQKERLLEMLDQATAPPPPDPLQEATAEQTLRGNEAKIAETEAKTAEIRARMGAPDENALLPPPAAAALGPERGPANDYAALIEAEMAKANRANGRAAMIEAEMAAQEEAARAQAQAEAQAQIEMDAKRAAIAKTAAEIDRIRVETEAKRAAITAEAKTHEITGEKAALERDKAGHDAQLAQALVASVQQGQAADQAMAQALAQLAAAMTAPKRLIRDASGKAIGVETVRHGENG